MKLLFLLTILFSLGTNAQVSTTIDASKIVDVQKWIANSKVSLEAGIKDIEKTSLPDQESKLRSLIDKTLETSDKKTNESAMRNVLARIIVVHDILLKTSRSSKRDALSRRILKDGITWALEMYKPDLTALRNYKDTQKVFVNIDFNQIGLDWLQYSLNLFYQMPTNESRGQFVNAVLGIVYNDINNDDKLRKLLAPVADYIIKSKNAVTQSHDGSLEKSRDLLSNLETVFNESQKIINPVYPYRVGKFIYTLSNPDQNEITVYDKPVFEHKSGPDCTSVLCVGDKMYYFGTEMVITGNLQSNGAVQILVNVYHEDRMIPYNCKRVSNGANEHCSFFSSEAGIENGFNQHIHVGDEVIVNHYGENVIAKAVAMNPYDGNFTYTQNGKWILDFGYPQYAYVRRGCYQEVCVGQQVGEKIVVGLNPLVSQPIMISVLTDLSFQNQNKLEDLRTLGVEQAKNIFLSADAQ